MRPLTVPKMVPKADRLLISNPSMSALLLGICFSDPDSECKCLLPALFCIRADLDFRGEKGVGVAVFVGVNYDPASNLDVLDCGGCGPLDKFRFAVEFHRHDRAVVGFYSERMVCHSGDCGHDVVHATMSERQRA